MKALFPGECIICRRPITRGDEVADSGRRGPKGGKKLAHAGCAGQPDSADVAEWFARQNRKGRRSRRNPMNNGLGDPYYPGMIPSDWPAEMFVYANKPIQAGWTTYPQYSYEQFARDNGRRSRRNPSTLLDDIRSGKAIDNYYAGKKKGSLVAVVDYYDGRPMVKLYGDAAKTLAAALLRTWHEQHGIKNPDPNKVFARKMKKMGWVEAAGGDRSLEKDGIVIEWDERDPRRPSFKVYKLVLLPGGGRGSVRVGMAYASLEAAFATLQVDAAAKALLATRRSRRNPDPQLSRPVYVPMPLNAGPYLPQMFPYGTFGRPAEYTLDPEPKKEVAKKNRSRRKARRNR